MPLEIERKFLIERPARELLPPDCRVKEILQTYLTENPINGAERRVRMICEDGKTFYIYTEKTTVTKRTRTENEREITKDEYRALYTEAVTELKKTRYAFPYAGHTVEIDVYPYEIGGDALEGKAVLEVELEKEDEPFSLPSYIRIEKELTGSREFSNKVLARPIR